MSDEYSKLSKSQLLNECRTLTRRINAIEGKAGNAKAHIVWLIDSAKTLVSAAESLLGIFEVEGGDDE